MRDERDSALRDVGIYVARIEELRGEIDKLREFKMKVETATDVRVESAYRQNDQLYHLVRVALKDPYLFEAAKTLGAEHAIDRERQLNHPRQPNHPRDMRTPF